MRLGIRTILDPLTLAPLTQGGNPDTAVLPKQGLIHRWEGGAPVELLPGQDLALENGVIIASRTVRILPPPVITGSFRRARSPLQWNGRPIRPPATRRPFPPHGVTHRYSPLAIVEKSTAGWLVKDDCRNIFPPLTRLESFFYLGGDGQEAKPDPTANGPAAFAMLDSALRVGVARGRTPVPGRPVRFRVLDQGANSAKLSLAPGTPAALIITNTPGEIVLRTDPGGVAQVCLAVHKSRHQNHLIAELLNASDPAQADILHLPIIFTGAPRLPRKSPMIRRTASTNPRPPSRGHLEKRAGRARQALPPARIPTLRRGRANPLRGQARPLAACRRRLLGQAIAGRVARHLQGGRGRRRDGAGYGDNQCFRPRDFADCRRPGRAGQ